MLASIHQNKDPQCRPNILYDPYHAIGTPDLGNPEGISLCPRTGPMSLPLAALMGR